MPRRPSREPRPERAGAARSPSSRRALAGLALAVALAAAAWILGRSPRVAIRRDPGLSVLLITVDTLRADALGSYGRSGAETPWMDRLAAGGVRFTAAHAHNVVTLPSHANILTGQLPTRHGIRDNSGFRLPETLPTLATLLKDRGYGTAAFVSAFPLDSRFGLARGFDLYDDRLGDAQDLRAFRMQERSGRETVAAARRWLAARAGARHFAWVHVYEPHFPYAPPEPLATRFAAQPYQGDVAAADAALGPLLEEAMREESRTLVILTSDHGESLGEHGEATHGIFAYEATLHVPLVLYAPSILSPRVVAAPVRHVDLLPTALDALGIEPPPGLAGVSLLPVADGAGAAPPEESYFEALSGMLNRGWAPLTGSLRGHAKYVDLPLPELYDLASDPAEAHNLAASEPERLEAMRGLLSRLRADDAGPRRDTAESAETRERLRALGYVSGEAPERSGGYTDADDPKRLIALDRQLEDAIGRYTRGDLAGALAVCEELLRQRPDMPLVAKQLGFLKQQAGDSRGAIAALERAIAIDPGDGDAAALLGSYLTEAGDPDQAVRFLEPLTRGDAPDLDVLNAYGVALASLGRADEALAAFGRVRALDPSNALAVVNAGVVFLMGGARDRARASFEAALELDPGMARAHNSLGVLAIEAGDEEAALRHWREAVRLDPTDYQTLYNLGTLLLQRGERAEAKGFLERYVEAAPAGLEDRDVARVRRLIGSLD